MSRVANRRELQYLAKQKEKARSQSKKEKREEQLQREQQAIAAVGKRMRCEEDVIARIKHDPSVEPSAFIIGHWDRVLQVCHETDFTTFFSHEDFVDIPLHRVRFIKYYDLVIWDRPNKLDCVYGSAGEPLPAPRFNRDWHFNEHIDFDSLPPAIRNLSDVLAYRPILAYRQALRLVARSRRRRERQLQAQLAVRQARQARAEHEMKRDDDATADDNTADDSSDVLTNFERATFEDGAQMSDAERSGDDDDGDEFDDDDDYDNTYDVHHHTI